MIIENLIFIILIIVLTVLFSRSYIITSQILGPPRTFFEASIIIAASLAGKFLCFWWGALLTIFVIVFFSIISHDEKDTAKFLCRCFWKKFVVYWLIGNLYYFVIHHNQLIPPEISQITTTGINKTSSVFESLMNFFKHLSFLRH